MRMSDWSSDVCSSDLRKFAQAMAALPSGSAEAVAEAAQRLFGDSGWLEPALDALAVGLANDPFFELPLPRLHSEIHDGILLFEDDKVSVAIGVTGADKLAVKKNVERDVASIVFTGHMSVLKFIRSGEALLSFWEAPPIRSGFAASEPSRCNPAGRRRLGDGETLIVVGRVTSYVIDNS